MLQTYFIFFRILFLGFSLYSNEPKWKHILRGESICKTYEISIPDYPNAHNPSIIPCEDGYLLSFRYICHWPGWSHDIRYLPAASFIGLAHLDKQFRVKKKSVQLLEIQTFSENFSLYAEDARLFIFQNRIFLLFNDFPNPSPEYVRRLYLGEITCEKGRWVPKKRALPLILDPSNRIEKNWVPFCIDSSLYLIYGEDPHTVLECDPSTGYCRRISERLEDLDWDYGIIRGGTPALKVDDQFLTFFHSSIENPDIYERRVYFMGAYAFDPYFPFAIRAYTPSPIGLAEYYEETSSKKDRSKKVVFPGGFIREGNKIHVAWGKDDKRVMISTMDLEQLLHQMVKR
ncbi:MAG: hypothetical protein A3D96_02580 [Chlamydiae bacterium RIFCSPHIGHO2_12_FULL_44_59]|nr:MAG: hypothetical protein A2796_05305 [Chlamydiae bacterium RIFCSPHIGHO2_01_FULL_44_39]OGN57066.1 MAG: hypothetical protein A3C42_05960 [Chlamydiae bacterium RIFCSPHIGHO2_02_FULL_45_9]OGN60001.1 MAG: hypothetical protein A3D96_02580 [Chlamydiae bacterium RIFCSPHIGHO2_12_FULL_44_59]OGN65928.1 MAG: hypothetical protein A2978_06395 [Chlamydiae bacterium RIFCSPLOWO2_01_FULL_44_52]OGN68188.1 MAG: hypothetical protein A3I67_07230 [Chlamydiae bacterium RIFCSPLOWO2_02_FULL_45_22]OGN70022.1 MAG: hyp